VTLYSVIVTVAVLLAVVVLILLFERKRARQIERDTRELVRRRNEDRQD
jgi:uncharacterized membrane protein